MEAKGLGDLISYSENRVERGHGFLKDHGNTVSPDFPHPVVSEL
jgi:hypothetical protein